MISDVQQQVAAIRLGARGIIQPTPTDGVPPPKSRVTSIGDQGENGAALG